MGRDLQLSSRKAQGQKTVMIIDDDLALRSLLAEAFSRKGYATCVADNGAEAFRQLELCAKPSFIILDLMMPIMDGWTFLEHRENRKEFSDIPLLIITGVEEPGYLPNIIDKLVKPFDLFQILETVENHIGAPH